MKFGLEIEFITDKEKLFKTLQDNNIEFIYFDKMKTPTQDIIVLKKENTLKDINGVEINFPPSEDFTLIEKVLKILNTLDITFNEKCALHVHIDFSNHTIDDLFKVKKYYLAHQEEIIDEAINNNVYVNLNKFLIDDDNLGGKFRNINLLYAFIYHKTVEHRIYKAILDFEKVKFCVEQTSNIVRDALKCNTGY